ncbi:MAG: hypothetical protein ABI898_08250 [Sphingomonadales bacterium]
MTASDPLTKALADELDRFDVPPMSAGLADRVVAVVTAPRAAAQRATPARDRRGVWKRGRQIAIGAVAFTMLSAAAIASGLLGKVGIEVPVLTAMLAPRVAPVHKSKPVTKTKLARKAPIAEPAPPPVVSTVAPPPTFVARQVLRAERRERIAEFVQEHPRAAAVIAQRIGKRLRQRETARREMLGLPPANPAAPDFRPLTPDERLVLQQERRRDFRRFGAIMDRRLARREAWRAARDGAPGTAGSTVPEPSMAANGATPAQ